MRLVVLATLAVPSVAAAHITLTDPPPRTTMEKTRHCGDTTTPRQANPKVAAPGSKYTVKWTETIDHPGHFRISFSMNNGTDFVVPPTSTGTTMGMPTVLVDLIPDVQGNFPIAGRPYTQEITLPNVECNNCTLQVIQLMTDKPPYTTDAASDDIYYQCADFILTNGAPPQPDAGVPPAGGDASTTDPGTGETSGGCNASGQGGSLAVAAGLVAVLARRRRR